MSQDNHPDPITMRPCLRIPELRRLVLEELEVISFPSLASLAVTCKMLSEDCLDHIWRMQTTLFYLFRTMSDDLYDHEMIDEGDGRHPYIVRFRRKLRAEDWERYDYYAPRIRHLKVVHAGLGVAKKALVFLSRNKRNQPFLPSLRRVKVCPLFAATRDVSVHVPMFLGDGTTIRRLSILDVNTLLPDFGSYIRLLTGICKNVRQLKIMWSGWNCDERDLLDTYEHTISMIGDDFRALCTPDGMNVTASMLNRLKNLPGLELLGPIHINPNTKSLFKSLQRDVFPSLHQLFLRLKGQCWDATHHFIRILRHNSLSELWITEERKNGVLSGEGQSFYFVEATLQEIGQHQTLLKTLHLVFMNATSATGTSEYDVDQLISPILSLSNLQDLNFQSSLVLQIDNDMLARISNAFPHITSLNLSYLTCNARDFYNSPRMTLAGLLPLIEHRPFLKHLLLTVRCQPFDPERMGKSTALTNQVESVIFSNSPVKEPNELMRCLLAMFPNAQLILWSGGNCLAETADGWLEARRLLEEEIEARKNKTNRAKKEIWEERIAALCRWSFKVQTQN